MKVLVMDNIRSVYNVGSMFRTANAVGIEKIYLCGITPTPLDKKGEKRSDFAKVALGAEETIAWEYKESAFLCVEELKKEGYTTFAIEQDERAIDYKEVVCDPFQNNAFILGSEVDGVSKEVLDVVDVIVEIPMLGTKESLNVTIACGIALYRLLGV